MAHVLNIWNPALHGSLKPDEDASELMDRLVETPLPAVEPAMMRFIEQLTAEFPSPSQMQAAGEDPEDSAWRSDDFAAYAEHPNAVLIVDPTYMAFAEVLPAVVKAARAHGLAVWLPASDWLWLPNGTSYPKEAAAALIPSPKKSKPRLPTEAAVKKRLAAEFDPLFEATGFVKGSWPGGYEDVYLREAEYGWQIVRVLEWKKEVVANGEIAKIWTTSISCQFRSTFPNLYEERISGKVNAFGGEAFGGMLGKIQLGLLEKELRVDSGPEMGIADDQQIERIGQAVHEKWIPLLDRCRTLQGLYQEYLRAEPGDGNFNRGKDQFMMLAHSFEAPDFADYIPEFMRFRDVMASLSDASERQQRYEEAVKWMESLQALVPIKLSEIEIKRPE